MKYEETVRLVDYLNHRLRKLSPWYRWSVNLTWAKLVSWGGKLGFKN